MNLQEFLGCIQTKTGRGAKKTGQGYSTCCPAHDDQNPSLSISEGTDGKILLKCFTGCPPEEICASLGLQMQDLYQEAVSAPVRTIYLYCDENGKELYRKVRVEPGWNGKKKSFYFERILENGKKIKSISGCHKVLYHLSEVLNGVAEGRPIYLVEGEKDADKLMALGLTATTSAESLFWSDGFSNTLKGADVILLYDMDRTGFKRRELICEKLHRTVKSLKIVQLPCLQFQEEHGQDVSDWLTQGHTTKDLIELASQTPLYFTSQMFPKREEYML